MPNATVLEIFITPTRGQQMQSVPSVQAVAGKGIVSDRNFPPAGQEKNESPEYEITLIESEAVDAAVREYKIEIAANETRRNILTKGVALNHLVGREFTVGAARLKGLLLCEPCKHLEKLTRPGVLKSLIHRGGLRAQILESGTISAGDPIRVD